MGKGEPTVRKGMNEVGGEKKTTEIFPKEGKTQFGQKTTSRQRSS